MSFANKKAPAANTPQIHSSIGYIVEITPEGVALVDFPENTGQPIQARSALSRQDQPLIDALPIKVILMFENDDIRLPVVTALVRDTLFSENGALELGDSKSEVTDAEVDGRRITFEAKEEIRMNCGKSTIILNKNGKIIIKGAQILSRSSGANKIKGSSVNIN